MGVSTKEITYDASGGFGRIFARVFTPDGGELRGVVQLVHGMAEHSLRYEDFARFLCEHGFAVCINDHAGHGKSAANEEDLGYFGESGYRGLVKDIDKLRRIVQEDCPGVPYFIMGHSMGSFLARMYMAEFGGGVTAAVFSGTSAGLSPAVMKAGIRISERVIHKKGPRAYDKRLKGLVTGGYNKAFEPSRTANDWLSRDEAQVDRYNADPLCGFDFTASGYRDLICLLYDVNRPGWFKAVPDVPILVFSGDRDPVGDFGKGVAKVAKRLKKTGHRVQLTLYPGGRHEMLNELNRKEVYEDILAFFEQHTGA